jgi:hypothetical protein
VNTRRIELAKYTDRDAGVLAGRGRGEAVRKAEKLSEIDSDAAARVEVVIPEHVFSVNSSFFLGMFTLSIRRLGPDEFRRRYLFSGPNAKAIVEDGIRKAMLTASPLQSARRAIA